MPGEVYLMILNRYKDYEFIYKTRKGEIPLAPYYR